VLSVEKTLRGSAIPTSGQLRLEHHDWGIVPRKGSSFFLFSQGDEYLGLPQSVVEIGQPIKGQAGYCGWIMPPILIMESAGIVSDVYSSKLGIKTGNLTSNEATRLVEGEPYNPVVNGNRQTASL